MQKHSTYFGFFVKKAYLLVIAAWLITLSFVVDNYWSAASSLQTVKRAVSKNLHDNERSLQRVIDDSSLMQAIESGRYSEEQVRNIVSGRYFLYFYVPDPVSGERLALWTTQRVQPYPSLLYEARSKGFIRLENGYYVWSRYRRGQMDVIALIPVKWAYSIQNEYLRNDFVSRESISAGYDISSDSTKGTPVYSLDGTRLFQLTRMQDEVLHHNNPVAVWMILLAVLFVLMFLQQHAVYVLERYGPVQGILLLALVLALLRWLTYIYPVPINLRQFVLFDPAVYGSGPWLRSLGDLFINVLLLTWVVMFAVFYGHPAEARQPLQKNGLKAYLVLILSSASLLAATFLSANLVRSLVADSQISFDVMNFFTLNIYSVIGIVILCCLSIAYFFLCQLIVTVAGRYFRSVIVPMLVTVAVLGLAYLSFQIGHIPGGFDIYVLAWLAGFLALLGSRWLLLPAGRMVSRNLVFWLFFFSVSVTTILLAENSRKELSKRMHYAEILSQKSDPAKETLMNTMLTAFDPTFLSGQFYRFEAPGPNLFLKDSLVNSNTAGYNNRFDTRVYTYNASEEELYNADSTSYNTINAILNTQAKPTNTPGLFYFDESYDAYSYISKRVVYTADSALLGYVFVISTPKKVKRDALYPELFSRGSQNAIEQSNLYAFALYNNWKLVSVHNDYPFPSSLTEGSLPSQQHEARLHAQYSELWYHAGGGRVVAIVKEVSRSIESITLFSYLFCSFLLVAAFFWLAGALIRSRLNWHKFKGMWQLSIRSQIHGTIIFISALSFVIIGFATILFFVNRYEASNREKLSRTIHIMEKELRTAFSTGWNMSDSGRSAAIYGRDPEQIINRISEIHGVDVNLYDVDGSLRISSLPMLYTRGIVSSRMDPLAYHHLHVLRQVQYYQEESIGRLSFASCYVPVKDELGNDYAYLNIPYFTSQSNLRQEISNFLVTIINLNAFIFLIAGIIALFITNRITGTFSLISEKMKRINLGTRNEAIEWNRKDEIGELVREYNKMVGQLEESARVLAKTEREGAWKEMARQVAHEIKNPLTPMKLSIQYLQKAIESNAPNVKELTAQVARTLVEQIDHLSQIAGDFSQFAHIGESSRERMDLNDVLKNVLDLYSSNDKLRMNKNLLNEPVMVIGDRTHMNRLFNNLVLNAIQAVPEERIAQIDIMETISDGHVLISISDNGTGIDPLLQSSIFAPNFTTKTSGTGLGLAMCKRIVEQADGDIWFDTKPGTGTDFFVRFPLA